MRYFERWAMAHDINKLPEKEREATAKEAITRWYSQPELVEKLEILGEWARQVSDRKDVPQAIREAGLGCYRQAVAAVRRAKGGTP